MSAEKPLAGKRILVTRALEQAGGLAEALEAEGASVLRLPTIEIIPPESFAALDAALATLQDFDWLIFTSANAVRAFAERMIVREVPQDRTAAVHVAAIGPATAKAATEHGLRVDLMPEEYVAESMVAALKEKIPGKHVLLARAAVARDVIPEELEALGAKIEVVEAYRTILPPASIGQVRALLTGELPDAVTFTSSSTVTNFLALLSGASVDRPFALRAVSIGPITTRTLRERDWEPAAQASEPSIPGLVEACVRLLSAG
ncbi:MAG TPA: uroporphyrinogen-III synthase [Acidobacteriaceae bacterium]